MAEREKVLKAMECIAGRSNGSVVEAQCRECPCDDYIKRSDVIREFAGVPNDLYYTSAIVAALEKIPAADVEHVKHGRWVQSTKECGWSELECAECSECGEDYVLDEWGYEDFSKFMSYCPNCGAKMDAEPPEEEKEENMDKYTIAEEAYKRGYADGLREAGKPRVLGYDEIEGSDAVWLEIRHTNGIVIEVTAFKTCGERMMGFEHGFLQSIPLYGKQWRCWSKKPTREQMEKEEWNK